MFESMNLIWVVFFGLLALLLILAIYWETADQERLNSRPMLNDLSEEDRNRELEFLACFNYENNVRWRSIFIGTTIALLLILVILTVADIQIDLGLIAAIFAAVFISFFGVETFRSYHYYRPMCAKVRSSMVVL